MLTRRDQKSLNDPQIAEAVQDAIAIPTVETKANHGKITRSFEKVKARRKMHQRETDQENHITVEQRYQYNLAIHLSSEKILRDALSEL